MTLRVALLEASIPGKRDRVFYPLGLAYIAGYLRQAHPEVEVRICRDLEELMAFRPQMAGISSVSPCFPTATAQAELIKKELAIPVILGGAHISTDPSGLPPFFDAGVRGEGEHAFLSLVELFMRGEFCRDELLKIPGLVLREHDQRVLTPSRRALKDLDSLPFPMREWTDLSPTLQWMFSSRGCPYRCSFCSSSVLWQGYRAHSPEYVVAELTCLLSRFAMSLCIFMDDLFAVDVKRLSVLKELMQEKVPKRPQLSVTLRAELATPEICGILKDMGASHVHLGLESGSDRILREIKCDTSSVAENQRALQHCHEAGLSPVGSFIIGSPGEGEAELEETLEFIARNLKSGMMKSFSFSPMVPFPGTRIWKYAVEKKLIDPHRVDWASLDIDIRYFTGEGYVLLTDRLSHDRFMCCFRRFMDLYNETVVPGI